MSPAEVMAASIRVHFGERRIRWATTKGHPLLSRISRRDDWAGDRLLAGDGISSARFVLTRAHDAERVTLRSSGPVETAIARIDAALAKLGARMARGLFVRTEGAANLDPIGDWLPETVTAEDWKGVDRMSNPIRYAGQRISAAGMPIEEAVVEADARAWLEGSPDDAPVYVGPADVAPMSLDDAVAAIENRACIRKLWRCNAGWGMSFVVTDGTDVPPDPAWRRSEGDAVVFRYFATVEQCVRAEHARMVEGKLNWVSD